MENFIANVYSSPFIAAALKGFSENQFSTINNAAVAAMIGYIVMFALVVLIIKIVSFWKIYEKAGRPGWAAIVPVYNLVILFQMIGLHPVLIILYFVPFINGIAGLVFAIMIAHRIAHAFGKSTGFALGLFFLPFIFYPILAFGKDPYLGDWGAGTPSTSSATSSSPTVPPTTM